MKTIWSPLSIDRVTKIAEYIAQDNLESANKWVTQLFDRVKQIERFPNSGRSVPEINRIDIREIFFQNYRIIYKTSPECISILTVRHSQQLLPVTDIPI